MKKITLLLLSLSVLFLCSIIGSCALPTDNTEDSQFEIKISDNIMLYFTNPGEEAPLEDALLKYIGDQPSGTYMDLCFYGLDRENLIVAIESVIARGVHVRFVGNKSGSGSLNNLGGDYYAGYLRIAKALDSKFPETETRADATNFDSFDDFKLINSAIMHNKFAIFQDTKGDKYLFTGTTNMTDTGFTRNNNNSLIFRNDELADLYRKQFESYLGLSGSREISTVTRIVIDNIPVDVLFAPQTLDGKSAMTHLMDITEAADSSIHFMIFSYPHMGLNDIMIDSALTEGLDVKGIFDRSQLQNGSEEYYAQRGIPVRIDGNEYVVDDHGGKLHHKTMIIDSDQNDAIVVTGSFNWSDNANNNNDENMLFIHSSKVATFYEEEWKRCWDEGYVVETIEPRGDDANPGDVVINEVLWMGSNFDQNGAVGYKDEFVELLNLTDNRINLAGWALKGSAMSGKLFLFPDNTYIEANSFLVITHYYNCDNPSTNQSAIDLDHSLKVINALAISNSSKIPLILEDQDSTRIDIVGDGITGWDKWAGYSKSGVKKSMMRINPTDDGTLKSSWRETSIQTNIRTSEIGNLYATPGAVNEDEPLFFNPLDIVISEIAWMGTDESTYDEWIELYNNSDNDINLTGWSISGEKLNISLSGTIPGHGYFLLERSNDDSVPGKDADLIYSGSLPNTGEHLVLKYNYDAIDNLDMSSGWVAGESISGSRLSMERIDPGSADMSSFNWKNGEGDIEGAVNSSGK